MENNDPKVTFSRKNVLPAFLGIIIGAGILLAIMMLLQPKLMNNALIFSFADVMAGCAEGSFFYQVMLVLEDLSEGTFMVSIPGCHLWLDPHLRGLPFSTGADRPLWRYSCQAGHDHYLRRPDYLPVQSVLSPFCGQSAGDTALLLRSFWPGGCGSGLFGDSPSATLDEAG